jgi:hypothetical protein
MSETTRNDAAGLLAAARRMVQAHRTEPCRDPEACWAESFAKACEAAEVALRAVVPPPPDTAAAPADEVPLVALTRLLDEAHRMLPTRQTTPENIAAYLLASGVTLRAPATDDAPTAEEVAAHFEARGLVSTAQTIRNFVRDHASPRATAPTPTED